MKLNSESVKLIVFDFDGVMTDNRVYVDQCGNESVCVNRSDGLGVRLIKGLGIDMVIISTETNPVVKVRAEKLKLAVINAAEDKAETMRQYCKQNNVEMKNVLYVGNDVNDLPAMKLAAIKVAPADAYDEVKNIADIVLRTKGGYGVVRELASMLGAV